MFRLDVPSLLRAIFSLALGVAVVLAWGVCCALAGEPRGTTKPIPRDEQGRFVSPASPATMPLTAAQQQRVNAARAGQCQDGACAPLTLAGQGSGSCGPQGCSPATPSANCTSPGQGRHRVFNRLRARRQGRRGGC